MIGGDEVILWAAVLGLLVGVIWSLRYLVRMQRELHDMHADLVRERKVVPAKKRK